MLLIQAPLNLITRLYLITTYSSSKLSLLILHYHISFDTSTTHSTHSRHTQHMASGRKRFTSCTRSKSFSVFWKSVLWGNEKNIFIHGITWWFGKAFLRGRRTSWKNQCLHNATGLKLYVQRNSARNWFNQCLIPYSPKSDRWTIACIFCLHNMRIWYQASKEWKFTHW